VFVAVYQKALKLLYVDELLERVRKEFSPRYKPNCYEYKVSRWPCCGSRPGLCYQPCHLETLLLFTNGSTPLRNPPVGALQTPLLPNTDVSSARGASQHLRSASVLSYCFGPQDFDASFQRLLKGCEERAEAAKRPMQGSQSAGALQNGTKVGSAPPSGWAILDRGDIRT
jgi:hypothetical protein